MAFWDRQSSGEGPFLSQDWGWGRGWRHEDVREGRDCFHLDGGGDDYMTAGVCQNP